MISGALRRSCLAAALATGLALAATQAAALSCTASASPTSFGGYDPLSAAPLDSVGNVQVSCSNLVSLFVSYSIALSAGSSGSFAGRQLSGGANTLDYNLYTNAAHSAVWGDGTAGSATLADGYLLLLLSDQRNYPVYGRIPAGQNVPPGSYIDSIVVTVNY